MSTNQTMPNMSDEYISKNEIEQCISHYYQPSQFKDKLDSVADSEKLMILVGRYIHYCSVFGASQANLAGAIGVRQELFQDHQEDANTVSDMCVEVAAGVFFGAIDEFYDRDIPQHFTHRSLAQSTLKGLALYYNWDAGKTDQYIHRHQATRDAIKRGVEGYGVGIAMDEAKLFRALGFHLGTEILADEEFCLLDRFFIEKRPDIAEYLNSSEIIVHGVTLPAYFWIGRHTIADAEHFDAAVDCAAKALKYYTGKYSQLQVREWILEGVEEIAQLESDFMTSVLADQS